MVRQDKLSECIVTDVQLMEEASLPRTLLTYLIADLPVPKILILDRLILPKVGKSENQG